MKCFLTIVKKKTFVSRFVVNIGNKDRLKREAVVMNICISHITFTIKEFMGKFDLGSVTVFDIESSHFDFSNRTSEVLHKYMFLSLHGLL